MCTTCGCGEGETRIGGQPAGQHHDHPHPQDHTHTHTHADGTTHSHPHDHTQDHGHGGGHDHDHDHDHWHVHDDGTAHSHPHVHGGAHGHAVGDDHVHGADRSIHYGTGPAGNSVPGLGQRRLVEIEIDVLARNNSLAAANRARLAAGRVTALNLVSSPGAGKTTLLVETLRRLGDTPAAVIEGDQETSADADRIRATGAPAIQINTGKGCHLDAQMVADALDHLPAIAEGVLFIENVVNLVCPAAFDLGEGARVVIGSVTEGEDKPLKYPGIFASADLMLVSKADLLPHLDFDVSALVANARRIRPGLAAITISAKTGEGFDDWLGWIDAQRRLARLRG